MTTRLRVFNEEPTYRESSKRVMLTRYNFESYKNEFLMLFILFSVERVVQLLDYLSSNINIIDIVSNLNPKLYRRRLTQHQSCLTYGRINSWKTIRKILYFSLLRMQLPIDLLYIN